MQQGPCLEHCYTTYAFRYMALGVLIGFVIVFYLMEWRRLQREKMQRKLDEQSGSCFLIPTAGNGLKIVCHTDLSNHMT